MGKRGLLETDQSAKAMDLKRELQRLVKEIVDEDDYGMDKAEEAMKILSALKELKYKKSISFSLDDANLVVPEEFRCPISKGLMKDPVILITGQTYDRPFIQQWLNEGHRTCPRTQQVLSHLVLTPNHLVREMISQWCKDHGVELPGPVGTTEDKVVTIADRGYFKSLLEKMSSSLSDQKEAAKELRRLTKRTPSFRALFGESPNFITQLLSPILQSGTDRPDTHPDLQEDLITTVLNLSIHDSNKKLVAEDPKVLHFLVESLKYGTIHTRSNAAAAIFTLSAFDSNKLVIGKSGALKPLINLLDEGHQLAMKDVASAIFNLCILLENKGRAVREGAVKVIVKKIKDRESVDELLSILAMLSGDQKAVEEMTELGAVSCLLSIIRESNSERNKENCIAIVYTIFISDRTKWREIREEENTNATISKLAQSGTSRAMRKANGILEKLNKAASISHTA